MLPQSLCGHQNSPRSYAEDDGHKLLNSDHCQPLTSRRNCTLRSRARMPKWICSFFVGLSLRSLQAEEKPSAVGKRDALADCPIGVVLGLIAIDHDLGTGR